MTIAAVLWDFGGVILSSPFDKFAELEERLGIPKDTIRKINVTNPDDNAWAKFERAEIDAEAFDGLFAKEAEAIGVTTLRGKDVLRCLSGDIRPAMVDMLDELNDRGFKQGCITNNVPTGKGAGMVRESSKAAEVAKVMERFDHIIESSKAGIRKPDPRIYQMMCEKLNVAPENCIYLDDLGINCKPAAQLGMVAIKVTGEEQALADLRTALGNADS